MTEQELLTIVCGNDIAQKRLAFCEIAESMFQYYQRYEWAKKHESHREQIVNEAADFALAALDRFNPEKGKATYFFMTIIAGYCHQLMRGNNDLSVKK
jgi:hypothetical protein